LIELKMSQIPLARTNPAYPEEVLAYAAEKGVEEFLDPHLEISKRLFPSAQRLDVHLEEDPEIADLRFIVFRVDVADMDVEQAARTQDQWIRESRRCCPPTPDCAFVLGLNLNN
jgi:hypothetical protein